MRMVDVIRKKRIGGALSASEIDYFVAGVTDGSIPDYQTSALLMAMFLVGLNDRETTDLTMAMAHSGSVVDLAGIPGVKVDKHSTGGVGDKTTLITAPIAAACGVPVAKMSGRGLGFTGGTIDKLEAIPGLSTALTLEAFLDQVGRIGIALAGQTGDLAPADKTLYALRDLTTTVDSIPLIAASVMSKKIAAGADKIVLDVKVGSGAFMKGFDDALALAETMVRIGELAGREVQALITDMDAPLGCAVGNALEVAEAIEVLRGEGPEDITELSLVLAAHMVALAGDMAVEQARQRADEALFSGRALTKLADMVAAQGGDAAFITGERAFAKAPVTVPLLAPRAGFITHMDAERIGEACMGLGAGRSRKESPIDPLAGITLLKKRGDPVAVQEPICLLHTSDRARIALAEEQVRCAVDVGEKVPVLPPLIGAVVTGRGITDLRTR